MERFVRRENIKHYRDLLLRTQSAAERERIQALLDEELKKQAEAGDDLDPRSDQEPTARRPTVGLEQ
jgi:hypothetical protein